MKTRLTKLWESRPPSERKIVAVLGAALGVVLYVVLLQSGGRARQQLQANVATLRSQATRLEQQAAELARLRSMPPVVISRSDLGALVQAQAGAAGLALALEKIDVLDANQVMVVFGAVSFADWLNWVGALKSQQVRLDTCRIEALSTPGMVSVSATLLRTGSP